MTILTPRLRIEPLTPSAVCAALMDRPALEKLLDARVPPAWPGRDFGELLPRLGGMLAREPLLADWMGVIVARDASTVVGDIGFKGLPDSRGAVEIGYSIAEPYRRRGYALEAARAMCEMAFHRGATAVRATCEPGNAGSIAVLARLGGRQLQREGGFLRWELRPGSVPGTRPHAP